MKVQSECSKMAIIAGNTGLELFQVVWDVVINLLIKQGEQRLLFRRPIAKPDDENSDQTITK